MKNLLKIIIFTLYMVSVTRICAQKEFIGSAAIPLQQNRSILFGKDIIINDQPDQNQQAVSICSAFNGWLYSVYTYYSVDQPWVTIKKSTDNGMSWTNLMDVASGLWHGVIPRFSIVACGTDTSSIKVFMGCIFSDTAGDAGSASVLRINGNTGEIEDEILKDQSWTFKDLALSSDNQFPAANSNPYSLGAVYSKNEASDSVIFLSSDNGGLSFNNRRVLAVQSGLTHPMFNRVALTYGRSASKSSGRYFALWEQYDHVSSTRGHLFTAHSDPDFNSSFTGYTNLDSLDLTATNQCTHPAIACQSNNADNDSTNLTEVILFEKFNPASSHIDISGFYNLQAATSRHFQKFLVDPGSNVKRYPDLTFNPFDTTFMVTYYDSTSQTLPFITHQYNFLNPNNWDIVSQGYNDNPDIGASHPKVTLSESQHKGAFVWTSGNSTGKGISLYDAVNSTFTGIREQVSDELVFPVVYPDPCSTSATFKFYLTKNEMVTVELYNALGLPITLLTHHVYAEGNHLVSIDVTGLPAGYYLYSFKAGTFQTAGKISVIK